MGVGEGVGAGVGALLMGEGEGVGAGVGELLAGELAEVVDTTWSVGLLTALVVTTSVGEVVAGAGVGDVVDSIGLKVGCEVVGGN